MIPTTIPHCYISIHCHITGLSNDLTGGHLVRVNGEWIRFKDPVVSSLIREQEDSQRRKREGPLPVVSSNGTKGTDEAFLEILR